MGSEIDLSFVAYKGNNRMLPPTEARDTVQLIGYVDLGYDMGYRYRW